jgi:AcrR family transcriptional regulator
MIVNRQSALACAARVRASSDRKASRSNRAAAPKTAERILAAAEQLFAERGYEATSLGGIADRVGVRPQAIYNHFDGKWALYVAVLERLLDPFLRFLDAALAAPPSAARGGDSLAAEIAYHAANPNLARIVQHAALAGGEQLALLIERWYRPFFQRALLLAPEKNAVVKADPALLPWLVSGMHSLVLGYATLAPLHRELLGIDPFSAEAVARQSQFVRALLGLLQSE